jgi:cob(I)alamin adenosyltransferase
MPAATATTRCGGAVEAEGADQPVHPARTVARGVERQIADYARAARWPAKPATTASK